MRKPLIALLCWGVLATLVGVQTLMPRAEARPVLPKAGSAEERAVLTVMRGHLQKSRELSRAREFLQARTELTEAVTVVKLGLGVDHPIMQVLSEEAHTLNTTAHLLWKEAHGDELPED